MLVATPAAQSATLAELAADHSSRKIQLRPPAPVVNRSSRIESGNNFGMRNQWRSENVDSPWILGQTGRPPERIIRWHYGQVRTRDDPYSWQYLDNNRIRIRWGNPLAPWTSAELQRWWQMRARVNNYFNPVW